MHPIVIHISNPVKWRNKGEFFTIQTVECPEFGLHETGQWSLTRVIKSIPIENRTISRPLRILRGDTPCFKEVPLKTWISDKRPEQLKRGVDESG